MTPDRADLHPASDPYVLPATLEALAERIWEGTDLEALSVTLRAACPPDAALTLTSPEALAELPTLLAILATHSLRSDLGTSWELSASSPGTLPPSDSASPAATVHSAHVLVDAREESFAALARWGASLLDHSWEVATGLGLDLDDASHPVLAFYGRSVLIRDGRVLSDEEFDRLHDEAHENLDDDDVCPLIGFVEEREELVSAALGAAGTRLVFSPADPSGPWPELVALWAGLRELVNYQMREAPPVSLALDLTDAIVAAWDDEDDEDPSYLAQLHCRDEVPAEDDVFAQLLVDDEEEYKGLCSLLITRAHRHGLELPREI